MAVTPGVGLWPALPSTSAHTRRTKLTSCMTAAPFETSATPGSTEWIKAHLARMDDSGEFAAASAQSVDAAEDLG